MQGHDHRDMEAADTPLGQKLANLSSYDHFMPHGHCYQWDPGLVLLHNVSDLLIFLAYFSIPVTLIYFVRRRRDLPFNWMFLCFALFIVSCGTTHFMEIITLYRPHYWLSGTIKAITAASSVPTAILLVYLVPRALAIPTPEALRRANSALQQAGEELEHRVVERTAELARVNAELEAEIAERRLFEQQLASARDEALEASRAKSVFLANMSHELRTPLNAIIGYSEMVLEGGNCPSEIRSDVEKISGSGNHLLELINAVLDLAKIEAGRAEVVCAPFDVKELAAWCVDAVRPMAKRNGNAISLTCAPDCGVMSSDLAKVRQIVLNLLSNAVKFTSSGTIDVKVSRQPGENGGLIAFEVHDNGIGIAPEDQKNLFQDFVQVDPSATKRYGGTGLGLSISRRLCSLLGGTISLTSTPGQGSCFTVVFPAECKLAADAEVRAGEFAAETGNGEGAPVPV